MKKIRVGIIGQGRSGRDIHGAYLKGDRRYRIVAAVDLIEQRRARAAAEYGCDVHADYRQMLRRRDIDLIVNSTPSHLHAPTSLEALRAGFHVLCEKPLAATVRQVDALIAAAKKAGKVLAIFQQRRFEPSFVKIRQIIDSGVLGRIVQISMGQSGFSRRWDWQTLQEYNGGNLANTGPHGLDQLLQLFGADVTPEVSCHMDRAETSGDAEDHVFLTFRAPGRPLVTLEISSCNAYPCPHWTVLGTLGGLSTAGGVLQWRYYKPAQAAPRPLDRRPICQPDGTPAYCRDKLRWYTRTWQAPKPKTPAAGQTGRLYTMLYKTLTQGAPLEITPQHVRQQIAIIEAARKCNPQIYARKRG